MSLNSNPVAAGQEVFCSRTIIETSKLLLRTPVGWGTGFICI